MGRPAKSLQQHLLGGSFRARRHHPLLAGPELPYPWFALRQRAYTAATSEAERRQLGREVEGKSQQLHAQTSREHAAETTAETLNAAASAPKKVASVAVTYPKTVNAYSPRKKQRTRPPTVTGHEVGPSVVISMAEAMT